MAGLDDPAFAARVLAAAEANLAQSKNVDEKGDTLRARVLEKMHAAWDATKADFLKKLEKMKDHDGMIFRFYLASRAEFDAFRDMGRKGTIGYFYQETARLSSKVEIKLHYGEVNSDRLELYCMATLVYTS